MCQVGPDIPDPACGWRIGFIPAVISFQRKVQFTPVGINQAGEIYLS